jgi:hypothetical protein
MSPYAFYFKYIINCFIFGVLWKGFFLAINLIPNKYIAKQERFLLLRAVGGVVVAESNWRSYNILL